MGEKAKNDFCLSLSDLALFLNKPSSELKEKLEVPSIPYFSPQKVREILLNENFQYKNEVISFQMLKGGVAKTTSALNIGIRASMYGARVLFIDLDQQANLSFALGVDDESQSVWLDLVEKRKNIEELVVNLDENIDLIPSGLNNSVLDRVLLTSNRNWSHSIAQPLTKIRHRYDLVIIDTAPAISATNTAVTVASDRIVLPVTPDRFSFLGLAKHWQELQDLKEDFNLNFEAQVLLTKYDAREKASHEILQQCQTQYSKNMAKHFIHTSSEVKNTIRTEKNIFSGKSQVKQDYDLIAREFISR